MSEDQRTISDWATKEFGYPTPERAITRMLEEVEELKAEFQTTFDYEKIMNECADIYITMCQVAITLGYNLHACIDHKMEINRHRKWTRKEDGTGYHVKE